MQNSWNCTAAVKETTLALQNWVFDQSFNWRCCSNRTRPRWGWTCFQISNIHTCWDCKLSPAGLRRELSCTSRDGSCCRQTQSKFRFQELRWRLSWLLGVSPADLRDREFPSARDQNWLGLLGEELWTIMDTEMWPFSIAEGKLFWNENLTRTHFHRQML